MPKPKTKIEIAAPPERVREIFPDFPSLPSYHIGLVKGIKPVNDNKDKNSSVDSAPGSISPGDKVECKIGGTTFIATIKESTPSVISWIDPPSDIQGCHGFKFEPSKKTPGGTTFRHELVIWRPLSLAMHLWSEKLWLRRGVIWTSIRI
ncbi:hypothetical protein MMC25_004060 [Agyrium rufum]|nr:hypothetical protein [Agyrium rufum]